MMSTKANIEQALTSLIATFNGPLPLELVELALSLLARSRSVAHSLKSEEEIARPYACAQLACERLKKRLNLPTITPRPPCPPRVYKKLYKYLESALPAATSAPSTPRKPAAQSLASTRTNPRTPRTPLSRKSTPRAALNEMGSTQEAPEWIIPTIRALVQTFSYPAATPHIYTGVESILPLLARMAAATAPETPSKRPRRSAAATQPSPLGVSDTRTLALIAVIVFYVLSRMMDQDITPEQFIDWRNKAVFTLLKTLPGNQATEENILTEIDELMPVAQEEGWLQMEWFLNITPPEDIYDMEGIEMTNNFNSSINGRKRTLKDSFGSDYIGLGTMMQDATDYLGERQRENYKRWKGGIIARIEQIEAS